MHRIIQRHFRFRAALLLLPQLLQLILTGGCAGTLQYKQIADNPGNLAPVYELSATPFYPQEIYQCGPAALATVLDAAGASISPDELAQLVYLPERRGSLSVELAAAVRHLGYLSYQLQPRLADLLAEIRYGRPVVVLQNLGLSW